MSDLFLWVQNERKKGQKRFLTVSLNLQYLFNPQEDTAEETAEEDVVAVDPPTDIVLDVGIRTRKRKQAANQNAPRKKPKSSSYSGRSCCSS